jgi:hypothetical protein
MKQLKNEKGVALVMVLVLSLIGLAIVSAMLFMLTQGSRMSGYHKMFRSADEAGLGGADAVTQMIKGRGTLGFGTTTLDACLQDKLNIARGDWATSPGWTTNCSAARLSMDPTVGFDYFVDLPGPLGTTYLTFTKIVDTVEGNSDTGGIVPVGSLNAGGVVTAAGGQISPPQVPYLYRIEVQTQDTANPRERSRYSVLYGY